MSKSMKSSFMLLAAIAVIMLHAGCAAAQRSVSGDGGSGLSGNTDRESGQIAETVQLTVSAAASLKNALEEIREAYEARNPSVKLQFNFGSSGALQQQIEQGAPADLFFSASPKHMQALVDKGLVEPSRQTALLINELVAVVPADGSTAVGDMADLTKSEIKYVAVGHPDNVPAGMYAKETIAAAGLWETLQPKMVLGKDVRQVLQYVETGNADAGLVYKTDALTSRKARIAFTVDPNTYSVVEYLLGIVKATEHGQAAEQLYAYLQSDEAAEIFVRYGFSVPAR